MKKGDAKLVSGPVGKTLARLTIPMVFGIVGMVAFNLVDTFFVGQLGLTQLAALSFTFPVVMVIGAISMGLGVGVSATVSRAIGEGNQNEVKRLTTDSLILGVIIVLFFVIVGLTTIDQLFSALGATKETLTHIHEYMQIWYLGVVFVIIPMLGNNAIRATGDTKTPSVIMLVAVFTNVVLDPLLIFGIGPFPKLGIQGAAIATVIARMTTFAVALYVLGFRDRMLSFKIPQVSEVIASWKKFLYIGAPNAATRLLQPLSIGVVTRIISGYGAYAVAAFGVATRIDFFSITVVMALTTVLAPFVGQNWGAGKMDRIKEAVKLSTRFALLWGLAIFIILSVSAKSIGPIFNDDPKVIKTLADYIHIVSISYGLMGVFFLATTAMNALNRPLHSAVTTIVQMFIFYIPLAYIGSQTAGLTGIFAGITIAYLAGGTIAHTTLNKIIKQETTTTNS